MNPMINLTNEELEMRLKEFISKEKFLLHIILDHIKEVDRRKLYLEKAYPSLYEYLVKELGYSGSAAIRRQEAARLLAEIPQLGQKIRNGSINLSQIVELKKAIKRKESLNYKKTLDKNLARLPLQEKLHLLSSIENKSTLETQKIVSRALDLPTRSHEVLVAQKDGSYRLEITLTQEEYHLLLQAKNTASHSLKQQRQDLSWASVLSYMAKQYLKKSAPNPIKKEQKSGAVNGSTIKQTRPQLSAKTKSTNLTHKMRRTILERDLSCQFQDPISGKICGSRFLLQVDHKVPNWAQPYANGPNPHHPTNLQVLCASHNQYKYQKECRIH